MNSRSEKIELVFELGSLDPADVARRALEVLNIGNEIVRLYGDDVEQTRVPDLIKAKNKLAFKIETSKASLHFATAKAFKLHLFEIRQNAIFETPSWDVIAGVFVGEVGFIQACVMDTEYSYWQSAYDPLQYEAAGRSYANLPRVSNGLPAPLEKLVIDVSGNPSRRTLRVGFVEMIGQVMWFGPKFWAIVGESRQERLLQSYAAIELPGGVVRIEAPSGPFLDSSTTAEQVAIRRYLFD